LTAGGQNLLAIYLNPFEGGKEEIAFNRCIFVAVAAMNRIFSYGSRK
jgi:hypothetical protein